MDEKAWIGWLRRLKGLSRVVGTVRKGIIPYGGYGQLTWQWMRVECGESGKEIRAIFQVIGG